MAIDPLPAAPQRRTDSPADYVDKADAWARALPVFGQQLDATAADVATNAANSNVASAAAQQAAATAQAASAAAVGATGYADTSASNISPTVGAKAIALTKAGNLFANGNRVTMVRISDPTIFGVGVASLADMVAKTMTVTFDTVGGAGGPYNDWLVILTALEPMAPATVGDVRTGTDISRAVTSGALAGASAFFPLIDASTVAWNTASGYNAKVTLGGNRLIGAPTGLIDGQVYTLDISQDATGSRVPSWHAIWDFGSAGLPTLSTAANKKDKVFAQYSAASGKLEASFRKSA